MRNRPMFLLISFMLLCTICPAAPASAQDRASTHPTSEVVRVPLADIAAIAAGIEHTCALTTDGAVKCWGSNDHGQLGNGTLVDSNTPVDVATLDSDVMAITAGLAHTCALTVQGAVKCWGSNWFGQLGDGTTTDRLTPVAVPVTSSLIVSTAAIAAGHLHTCALTTLGGVKCWGDNGSGQIGDGTTDAHHLPTAVPSLTSDVDAITAGDSHNCALTPLGVAKCWGSNQNGQLGDGTTTDRLTPITVDLGLLVMSDAVAAGGGHTCALTANGVIKCWGYNGDGQLGDGTTTKRLTPVTVSDLPDNMDDVAAGGDHTCALTTPGGVKCWGANDWGQIGDGTTTDRLTPVNVPVDGPLLVGTGAVALGGDHTCALSTGGNVKCWGGNYSGQLGDATTTDHPTPQDVLIDVTCYELTRAHTGSGADPTATPPASDVCSADHFLPGETVVLNAAPAAGWRVKNWTGATTVPGSDPHVASLTMAESDRVVSVAYERCYVLSTTVVGQGDPIQASPSASTGCTAGAYAAGAQVTLTATPASGWHVEGWSGTSDDASTSATNSVTMPAADTTVGVTYGRSQEYLYLPMARR